MSAIAVRNVWVEYGDQVVLERINLDIAERRLPHRGRPVRRRQEHVPAPDPRPGARRPAARSSSTASRCPAEPGPDRGVVFQRYSVFPHLTVLGNVLRRLRVRRQPLCSAA